MTAWECALYLEKGHLFLGEGFGAETISGGEAVFNTGMTGYQEIFTDPSYYKQIVVMTYPHLGNTAVNEEDVESSSLYLSGVVTREYCEHPSNWRQTRTLDAYLKSKSIPGISGIDTRRVTELLRDEGAQRGIIFPVSKAGKGKEEAFGKNQIEQVENMDGLELVSRVSCKAPYFFQSSGAAAGKNPTVVVYDYGVKTNILRSIKSRGFDVWVVPYNYPYQDVLKQKPSAVLLSNGPGDPATVPGAVEQIQGVLGQTPLMAICMGHQLLARSLGCKTYKLKFGHHGVNHPVKDLKTGRILITSQNHGFSVKAEDLRSRDLTLGHVSLNDNTVEGFSSDKLKFVSVQFHPESKPGPSDASVIFDSFIKGFVH